MRSARLFTAARVLLVLVLAAGALTGGYFGTRAIRSPNTARTSPVPPLPAAYARAGARPAIGPAGAAGPQPAAAAVRRALAGVVSAPGLGARLHARVVDVASGTVLYDRGGSGTGAPASTAKLLTAAAVLAVHRVTDRISTRVVSGRAGAIVLVGGGDPTLSGAAASKPTDYPGAARISDLAAQLRRAHVRPSVIVVDDTLFGGPAVSPKWAPEDVPSGYASAITALLADGGRAAPDDAVRSAQPDLAAAHELATALGRPGLPVTRGAAPAGARTLATVSSATYGELVEQMLQTSDNVIAECLARQVAIADHAPATFTGAARAVRAVLARLGADPGAGMLDGSGLAAADRLSPAGLVGVLRLVADGRQPALHTVLAALPVSGWSGTLGNRYVHGTTHRAAGLVRAKTGSLTGVATLAGVVHDRSGRMLAFALMADRTGATSVAEAALDAIVTRLAGL